jgi:hypothetical protein
VPDKVMTEKEAIRKLKETCGGLAASPGLDKRRRQERRGEMDTTILVLLAGAAICLAILILFFMSLRVANQHIFPGSGRPAVMAQMLLSSIHLGAQHLLGVFVIAVLSILLVKKIISTETGLPLLSAIAGYLLGKNFRDVSFTPTEHT